MDTNRLKIKIGEHEFEAEGPVDVVQDQFAAFKELIANMPKEITQQASEPSSDGAPPNGLALEKITRVQGRTVSLTVHVESIPDAILVLLLGQRKLRNNDSVTGGEIMDGLRESGQIVTRVDHTLNHLSTQGGVIRIGTGRGRRYRLTNIGIIHAEEVAKNLISLVP